MSPPARTEHQERISEAMKLHWKKRKGTSKYRNAPTEVDGIKFASKREAHRYCELKLLLDKGQDQQSRTTAGVQVRGQRFAYWDGEKRVVEDSKGMRTPEFKLKRALVEAMYPAVKIVEV